VTDESYAVCIWIFCVLVTAARIMLFINYILPHNWINAQVNIILTNRLQRMAWSTVCWRKFTFTQSAYQL